MHNIDEMERFSNIILEKVKKGNLDYLDAIVSYCEELQIDQDVIIDLISPFLLSKIEEEALVNKTIKNTTRRLQL